MQELMYQKELIGDEVEQIMQKQLINKQEKNLYIIGTIELQALKKLLKNNLITEDNYNLIKEKIIKEYHILV